MLKHVAGNKLVECRNQEKILKILTKGRGWNVISYTNSEQYDMFY